MYAIIKTGGKQYKAVKDGIIDVEKLPGEAGDKVELQAIFFSDGENVITEADKLANVKVTAEIVEQFKGEKVIIFKFKKRKGYKKTQGHRQQLTKLRIVDLGVAE